MKILYGAVVLLLLSHWASAGKIALTFDDAPTGDSALMSGEERTQRLIAALKNSAVPDALFFVKTDAVTPSSNKRLNSYTKAGFHLANHSHSHRSANKIPPEEYLQDIAKAQRVLSEYKNVLPFHRFPYLHYGADKAPIEQLQNGLAKLGYNNGYVTVDNYDWYMNALLVRAKEAGKEIDYQKAADLYVETLWQAIAFYDKIAQDSLGRSPKHVLLLHENDAAALFLSQLVERIRQEGWEVISPQEAYRDPIAEQFPAGLFHKQGRVAALAHSKGMPMEDLRHPAESEAYLDALFERAGVFE